MSEIIRTIGLTILISLVLFGILAAWFYQGFRTRRQDRDKQRIEINKPDFEDALGCLLSEAFVKERTVEKLDGVIKQATDDMILAAGNSLKDRLELWLSFMYACGKGKEVTMENAQDVIESVEVAIKQWDKAVETTKGKTE